MSTPRVSVLLPVYNAQPYLVEAVESVLGQTYEDFEVLLVDDGSTDGSGAICDAFAARDARVRVLRHPGGVNRGLVASLNLGLDEACGEFIARMDADDRCYPERFAKQVAFLDANPAIGVLGTAADSFDGTDWSVWGGSESPEMTRWGLLFTTPMVHPSVMMRRDVIGVVGGYNPAYPHLEDYKFFYDLSKYTSLATLPEPLMMITRDIDTNVSTRHRLAQFDTCLSIHREIWGDYGVRFPEKHQAIVSGCLFARPDEVERVHGPLSVEAVNAAGRTLHALARAFISRHQPTATTRAEMQATLRWCGWLLETYLVSRNRLPRPAARALRLSWDLPGAARRALYRVTRFRQ